MARASTKKAGSCDAGCRKPRQDRKVAAVRGIDGGRRNTWLEPIVCLASIRDGRGARTTGPYELTHA